MTWHVEPTVLEAYAHETIDEIHAFSVEAHLMSCEPCREQIAELVDRSRLEVVWTEVADAVMLPAPGVVEKLLLRLGVKEHIARLLVATPALRVSWFAAIALALTFALVAAHSTEDGYLYFLVLAPMPPPPGVTTAYGPGVDPTYEIGLAAPMRSFHLLMIRAAAVLTSSTMMSAVASFALPQLNWAVAAWLLPSLGLTAATLALSTVIRPLRAATGVAVTWLAGTVLAMGVASRSSATVEGIFGGLLQIVLLVVTLASAMLLYRRQDRLERGAHR
jgi:hypothetical protein